MCSIEGERHRQSMASKDACGVEEIACFMLKTFCPAVASDLSAWIVEGRMIRRDGDSVLCLDESRLLSTIDTFSSVTAVPSSSDSTTEVPAGLFVSTGTSTSCFVGVKGG